MLGKKRGVTQRRSNTDQQANTEFSVLSRLCWFLGLLFGGIVLFLWHPWQSDTDTPMTTNGQNVDPASTNVAIPSEISQGNFQFYDELRTQQVTPVPDHAPDIIENNTSESDSSSIRTAAGMRASRFILQINSFKTAEEADELTSAVKLLGIKAQMQVTDIKGISWYRVSAGPFDSKKTAQSAQKVMQNSSIDALLVEE